MEISTVEAKTQVVIANNHCSISIRGKTGEQQMEKYKVT